VVNVKLLNIILFIVVAMVPFGRAAKSVIKHVVIEP
ncbi:uncharacterized protein METZ01_LOCUS303392, partial [marine metagenome]